MYVKSIYVSAYVKAGNELFELLDSYAKEFAEHTAMQFITDNGNNHVFHW